MLAVLGGGLLAMLTLAAAVPLGGTRAAAAGADGGGLPAVCAAGSREQFRLLEKTAASPDAQLLRFALPHSLSRLPTHDGAGYRVPTGVYCIVNVTADDGELRKSYSPVSLPDAPHLDLLVKAYPYRPGGGLGKSLCELAPGDNVLMEIKPARYIHGSTAIAGRWKRLGFVAGGTGVAPMIQMIRFLLAVPGDETEMWLLGINRYEHDILMRHELEELAAAHPERLHLTFSLTQPPVGWKGPVGRGSVAIAEKALPPPPLTPPPPRDEDQGAWGEGDVGKWGSDGLTEGVRDSSMATDSDVMIMVCGTDGFVATWAGAIERRVDPVTGKSAKVQGPLKGLLSAVGFQERQVYKF
eukprot:Tamp_20182.p1 GENE.Tamp_20182~~Tamp_20182.p1  ORF type:complete len:354 (-),score=54.21 Tamp_20182:152-1213(-)